MTTSEKIRVALVHTTLNAVGPLNETFARSYPEVEIINLLDEGLLLAVNEQGGVNAALLERFVDLIHKAIDSRAQGVLASCSSFSPWIPQIQQMFDIPLLSVDEAILKKTINLFYAGISRKRHEERKCMIRIMADDTTGANDICSCLICIASSWNEKSSSRSGMA
jgi:hypothetical protein